MPDDEQSAAFWEKAMENLESARSEFGFGRYNACANRCYFACFQAAIVALARGGIVPRGRDAMWGHAFV
ncbi:MAG: HEPN domain-containing protein [Dehalococcoidia bacterium]